MYIEEGIIREVGQDFCEHCGKLNENSVTYKEGKDGCSYCSSCAYAEGWIDDEQYEKDYEEYLCTK